MSELAPATLEGWYSLHQVCSVDFRAIRSMDGDDQAVLGRTAAELIASLADPPTGGWTRVYQLAGGGADLMFVHFRETLDELARVQLQLRRSQLGALLHTEYDFTSVTEAGLYHATAQAAAQAKPHSREYYALLGEEAAAERASENIQVRLFPRVPEDMRYVCFYPMSKRRTHPDNWYALPVDERNRMMREHGLSGRRYAGRVFQIITGAIGFDDWEWGVTLYARDPLEFKRIVTDLRYDEASARYGEFGEFFTGVEIESGGIADVLRPA
jgi:hydrogen peroxide-dependent heme synthase